MRFIIWYYHTISLCFSVSYGLSDCQKRKEKITVFQFNSHLNVTSIGALLLIPTGFERSALSLRWPLTAAHGSAPSLHKHGSSMASNSSGGGSSDRQRTAQQRLKIIAGHLQRSEDGDSTILAAECKAQKTDVSSEGKTVPRRRYKAVMERWTWGPASVALASY